MVKKILLILLKASLALGLLWWLVDSGKLNWKLITELESHPWRLGLAVLLCLINLILCTWRWRYILSARTAQKEPLINLVPLNWIGLFFSSVLPGSVTGDVIKIFYVKKKIPELSSPFLFFSCLLDRVMGLAGLILLMGSFSLFNYQALLQLSPSLRPLLHFNFLLLTGLLVCLGIYFKAPGFVGGLLDKVPLKGDKFGRIKTLWGDLVLARASVGRAIVISILVQFIGVLIFHVLASPFYTTGLSLKMVLSFIPLGFMVLALPIAPGGLGVGHAAFQTLFGFAGEASGANFFNMYFVVMMVFNLIGVVPWLRSKMK